MDKEKLLKILEFLGLPKTEYYILSGGAMLLYGLREKTNDLDLCVSNDLFEILKEKYKIEEKNEAGFYRLAKRIEIIPSNKESFQMEYREGYPVEKLETILQFKEKRNLDKDKKDIENIRKYLKNNEKDDVHCI